MGLLYRFTVKEGRAEDAGDADPADAPQEVVHFAFGACGSSAAGLLPARLNFIMCAEESGFPLMLRYKRLPQVASAQRLPFCPDMRIGMMDHRSLDDLGDLLVAPSENGLVVTEVSSEILRYTEAGGDRFLVTGNDDVRRVGLRELAAGGPVAPAPAATRRAQGGDAWDDVLPRRARGTSSAKPRQRRQEPHRDAPADIAPPEVAIHGDDEFGLPGFAEELAHIMEADGLAMVAEAEQLVNAFSKPEPPSTDEDDDATTIGPTGETALGEQPAQPAISAENCMQTLRDVHTSKGVEDELPDFVCSGRGWQTSIRSTGEVLGKVRCIQGRSMRADCTRHSHKGVPCKVHCDIGGQFARLDAELSKWLIAGSAVTHEKHQAMALELQARWRAHIS